MLAIKPLEFIFEVDLKMEMMFLKTAANGTAMAFGPGCSSFQSETLASRSSVGFVKRTT